MWLDLTNAGDQLSGRGEKPQCFPNKLVSASVPSDLKNPCLFHLGLSKQCLLGALYPNEFLQTTEGSVYRKAFQVAFLKQLTFGSGHVDKRTQHIKFIIFFNLTLSLTKP